MLIAIGIVIGYALAFLVITFGTIAAVLGFLWYLTIKGLWVLFFGIVIAAFCWTRKKPKTTT